MKFLQKPVRFQIVLRWSSSFSSAWKLQRLRPEDTAAVRTEMRHFLFHRFSECFVLCELLLSWLLQITASTPTKPAVKKRPLMLRDSAP